LVNVNDPLFTDLALKVIAGRASEAERSELAVRVARHPELEAELENLRADAAFAKEVLPLLGDEQVKAGELPGYARARLRAAVKRSLGNPASPQTTSNPTVVEMVWQWRWWLGLGTAAAVGLIVVSLNSTRMSVNTARNANSKPLVQLAMLDSMGQTRGTAALQGSLQLAATLKGGLEQTNLTFFSETAELKKWVEEWPSDNEQPAFKVWYDRDASEVRVLGRWGGKQQIERRFPVANERDLAAVLEKVVADFEKAPRPTGKSK
jgi:hypothetical protein